MVDAARALGVREDDICTTGCNLWTETRRDDETGMPTGELVYHVSKQVEVTLGDPEQVDKLVIAALGAGADWISGVEVHAGGPETRIRFLSALMRLGAVKTLSAAQSTPGLRTDP